MCYHDIPSVHLITWNQKDMGLFKVRNDNKSIWAHKDHLSNKDAGGMKIWDELWLQRIYVDDVWILGPISI